MKWTIRFTSVSCGSKQTFTIPCNNDDVLPSSHKIGPRIVGSMKTIGTYVVVLSLSFTVSSLKTFPYGWDWNRRWTYILSHLLSPLEWLPSSTWIGGLGMWSTPHYFQIPFFQLHPKISYCTYLFFGESLPRNSLLWCTMLDDVAR